MIFLSACVKKEFNNDSSKALVTISQSSPNKFGLERNVIYSDLLNWDSIKYEFLHFQKRVNYLDDFAVFISRDNVPYDTLIFRVFSESYNSENGYYFDSYMELYSDKFSSSNIEGGTDIIALHRFKLENSSEIYFDTKIYTNIRIPGMPPNRIIKNIKGCFVIPDQ